MSRNYLVDKHPNPGLPGHRNVPLWHRYRTEALQLITSDTSSRDPLMSSPYICASCRRAGKSAGWLGKLQWDSRASFISLNPPQPGHDGAATTQRGDEYANLPRSSGRNRATKASIPKQQQWPLARNSRDDILESLFLSPRNENTDGVYKGRYSASKAKESDATSENGSLSSQTLSLDPGSSASNSTERGPSLRRPAKVRGPPITTLKRLPVHQRRPTDNNE